MNESAAGQRVKRFALSERLILSGRGGRYPEETETLLAAGGTKDVKLDKEVIAKVFDLQSEVSFEYFSIKHQSSCGSKLSTEK